jgi:hypothetical protein
VYAEESKGQLTQLDEVTNRPLFFENFTEKKVVRETERAFSKWRAIYMERRSKGEVKKSRSFWKT